MQPIHFPSAAAKCFHSSGNSAHNNLLPILPFFLNFDYHRWFLDIISVINVAINIKLVLSSIINNGRS